MPVFVNYTLEARNFSDDKADIKRSTLLRDVGWGVGNAIPAAAGGAILGTMGALGAEGLDRWRSSQPSKPMVTEDWRVINSYIQGNSSMPTTFKLSNPKDRNRILKAIGNSLDDSQKLDRIKILVGNDPQILAQLATEQISRAPKNAQRTMDIVDKLTDWANNSTDFYKQLGEQLHNVDSRDISTLVINKNSSEDATIKFGKMLDGVVDNAPAEQGTVDLVEMSGTHRQRLENAAIEQYETDIKTNLEKFRKNPGNDQALLDAYDQTKNASQQALGKDVFNNKGDSIVNELKRQPNIEGLSEYKDAIDREQRKLLTDNNYEFRKAKHNQSAGWYEIGTNNRLAKSTEEAAENLRTQLVGNHVQTSAYDDALRAAKQDFIGKNAEYLRKDVDFKTAIETYDKELKEARDKLLENRPDLKPDSIEKYKQATGAATKRYHEGQQNIFKRAGRAVSKKVEGLEPGGFAKDALSWRSGHGKKVALAAGIAGGAALAGTMLYRMISSGIDSNIERNLKEGIRAGYKNTRAQESILKKIVPAIDSITKNFMQGLTTWLTNNLDKYLDDDDIEEGYVVKNVQIKGCKLKYFAMSIPWTPQQNAVAKLKLYYETSYKLLLEKEGTNKTSDSTQESYDEVTLVLQADRPLTETEYLKLTINKPIQLLGISFKPVNIPNTPIGLLVQCAKPIWNQPTAKESSYLTGNDDNDLPPEVVSYNPEGTMTENPVFKFGFTPKYNTTKKTAPVKYNSLPLGSVNV